MNPFFNLNNVFTSVNSEIEALLGVLRKPETPLNSFLSAFQFSITKVFYRLFLSCSWIFHINVQQNRDHSWMSVMLDNDQRTDNKKHWTAKPIVRKFQNAISAEISAYWNLDLQEIVCWKVWNCKYSSPNWLFEHFGCSMSFWLSIHEKNASWLYSGLNAKCLKKWKAPHVYEKKWCAWESNSKRSRNWM